MIPQVIGDIESKYQHAIVLYGSYSMQHTANAIREFLDNNKIPVIVSIVGICKEELENQLSSWEYNTVEVGQKPYAGRLCYVVSAHPEDDDFYVTNMQDQNVMRLAISAGISHAKKLGIKFCLICKADAFLGKHDITTWLQKEYLEKFPVFPTKNIQLSLKYRIVVSEYCKTQYQNPERPGVGDYHIPLLWFFGHIDDLETLFQVNADTWKETHTREAIQDNFVEMWLGLPKVTADSGEDRIQLPEVLARYTAIPSTIEVEFNWLSVWHQDYRRYKSDGKRYLTDVFAVETDYYNLIKSSDWLELMRDQRAKDSEDFQVETS